MPARLLPELSTEQPWQEDEATENSQPPPHRLASFGSAPPDRQRACSCRVASLDALRSESGSTGEAGFGGSIVTGCSSRETSFSDEAVVATPAWLAFALYLLEVSAMLGSLPALTIGGSVGGSSRRM